MWAVAAASHHERSHGAAAGLGGAGGGGAGGHGGGRCLKPLSDMSNVTLIMMKIVIAYRYIVSIQGSGPGARE